jgi:excinuclease ABC subunit C
MVPEHLVHKVEILPSLPGVYKFYDKNGKIIYVGKAKNLKKRVSSYFNKTPESGKVQMLVRKIRDIEYIVVDTETDALLLENNLIKKYQPRYNVMLKDDKTYPFIVIKNEPFPRVFLTRNVIRDGSQYYGPYTSARLARSLLDLFRKLFYLRTCKYNLTQANIKVGKFKVCLEYHIKKCKAPCVGLQTEEEYLQQISQIRNILKGNITEAIRYLEKMMKDYAAELKFEQAQEIKERIDILKRFQAKSTVVNPSIHNVDVFAIADDDTAAYINYFNVVNGAIMQTYTAEIKKKLNETKQELLQYAIVDIRERFNSKSKEILVPFDVDIELEGVTFTIPKIGDKKHLLDLAERNVHYYKLDKKKQKLLKEGKSKQKLLLEQVKEDLKMNELPVHIECFDNSNIQGTNPVASCVVFKNGKPSKKDYRKFNIKTVEGPNDFASMEEIVFRRYRRLLDEAQPLPQLIVIDGGKGQLNAALKSLKKLGIEDKVKVIGIAKRLEEIYFPGHKLPLYLDKRSPTLRLIQQIRDEAHRFGITFHRDKRSKSFLASELDNIKGIGHKTKEKLLMKFKTVDAIKKADYEEVAKLVGEHKAKLIFDFFKEN